jgi:hypothetical protein
MTSSELLDPGGAPSSGSGSATRGYHTAAVDVYVDLALLFDSLFPLPDDSLPVCYLQTTDTVGSLSPFLAYPAQYLIRLSSPPGRMRLPVIDQHLNYRGGPASSPHFHFLPLPDDFSLSPTNHG